MGASSRVGPESQVWASLTRLALRLAGARSLAPAGLALIALAAAARPVAAQSDRGQVLQAVPVAAASRAVVNFSDLARAERLGVPVVRPPVRPLVRAEQALGMDDEEMEPGAGVSAGGSLVTRPPYVPFVASPSPTLGFMGLDDIPMVDSSYIVIPPDVSGAVGLTKVLQGLNNNYRILNKSDGSVVSTVGTATFWSSVVAVSGRNTLTDPRTVYDPINHRFIVCMISDFGNSNSSIEIGVSQTSDPSGSWFLFRVPVSESNSVFSADFPILGFNRNWLAVTVNMYTNAGAFSRGKVLMVYYPDLRAGTLSSFTVTRSPGTGFCASPCVTLSATADTLYVPTHLSSANATYQLDRIVGTGPGAPTYVVGGSQTRPGGGWVQGGGNELPQSAPNAGSSACGATPCPIENQDAQIRSAPVYRGGFIYYAQSVGLPSGSKTHMGVQWTKLNTPGGTVADGGRIEEATATSSNGGKWYAYPHIAVNANHDFLVGYTQFSSAQHPSAGYSVHLAGDAAGSIRDAQIYHSGEDYYHKTFSTTTGRNRWGDFSTAQVDPGDDMTLWTVQEYGKTRPGTDDGNTGANSSRWSTWWTALAPPSVTIDAGPSQDEGNSGTTAFNFTVRLSYAYGLPVTVNFQTADGTATVADNDYQALGSSVVIPAGGTSAPLAVNVVGDTRCESDETFTVMLTSTNNNIPLGATVAATGTIVNDELVTLAASAGAGGTISPSGAVPVACGASQGFTIAPDLCHVVADVVVDGVSQGVRTSFTFDNVTTSHTISASFAPRMTLAGIHTDASCHGVADGAIDLTVSGGTGGLTYAWSNGAATEDVSGLAAGSYSVTVTDADACTANLAVSVGEPAALALGETHVDVTSCGAADGAIDLTVAGGTAPYGCAWSNGATSEDLSGLAGGSYTVTVTDAHGCSAQTTVAITAPGAPGLGETHADASCHDASDGSVDLTVTGGTGPFTFAWSNGATTEDLAGLAAGTYNVTVTDASACQASLGVTIAQPAALVLSETHADVCTGGTDGAIDLTVAGGTAPYGYAWSNGAASQDLGGLAAGTYTVAVTDAHGCAELLGVTIAVTQHSIVSTAGANGTISPLGATPVACGTDQTYAITPDPGYTVNTLRVDASPVAPADTYTFTNVTADHTIDVTFASVTAVAEAPASFALGVVVPNPTRGTMRVPFGLPTGAGVRVSVIDLQGRELAVLADGPYPAGWHVATWNGRTPRGAAGAGLYFVRYRLAGGPTLMRKFVLAR